MPNKAVKSLLAVKVKESAAAEAAAAAQTTSIVLFKEKDRGKIVSVRGRSRLMRVNGKRREK